MPHKNKLNKVDAVPVDCSGPLPSTKSHHMKTKFIIASIGLAVALAFTPAQAAKPKSTDAPAPAPAKPAAPAAEKAKRDTYPLYGEVVAVTPKLLTIKGGKGKEDRKFDITADTVIHAGEKSATIADVKVGRKVGGLLKKSDGKGNDTVVKLNTDVAQETTKKKAEDGDTKKKK